MKSSNIKDICNKKENKIGQKSTDIIHKHCTKYKVYSECKFLECVCVNGPCIYL